MGAFPIPQAQLAALFMQSIAYGIHAVTFAICMYTWFNQSNNSWTSASRIWLSIAIGLFVIGTCDVAFNFYHNLMAFITAPIGMSPTEVFDQASNWVNVMRSVWFYMNAALSDAALIYRCWKVYYDAKPYHRAIVVIVPTILWAACISFASMIIYYLSTVDASTTIPMIPQLQPFLYSFYVTTVVLNLFTTGLIISKCWERHQDNSGDTYLPTRKRLNFADIIRITVESALLYTTTVVFCVVLDLARTNAYYGITDISLEAAGISFDLMIIRIWTGASTELSNLKFSGAVLIEAQRGAGGRLCSLSNRAGGCGCRHSNRTSALPIANEGGGGEELQEIPMGHHNHANDDEVHGTAALRYFTAPGRCLVIDHSQDARTRLHCRNSLGMDVKWRDGDGESQVV